MANKAFNELTNGTTPQDGDRMAVDRGGGPWSTVYLTLLAVYDWILGKLETDNRAVPTGGSAGDVLKRAAFGATTWSAEGLVPAGSVVGYVLRQTGGGAYDHAWGVVRELPEPNSGGLDDAKFVQWDGASWVYAFAPDQSAGSDGQLQYKATGGGFAGASKAGVGSSGSLELTVDAAPTTPAAGKLAPIATADGGGATLAWVDEGGTTYRAAQRAKRRVSTYTTPGSSALAHLGLSSVGEGTAGAVSPTDSAPPVSSLVCASFTTAASAGSSAGFRYTAPYLYRGSDTSSGGFCFRAVWSPQDAATVAQRRCFVGLIAASGAFGNVDPSSKTDVFGVGADSGDANLSIVHNDSSGTATKITLTGFGQADTTAVYEVELWCAAGSSALHYRVTKRVAAGAPTILQGSVSSEIPAANTLLTHYLWVNNGSTALAARVYFAVLEVDRDV